MAKKHIVIGITGGIAAVKIPLLIETLLERGHDVSVIMTESACRIIDSKVIEQMIKKPVYTTLFPDDYHTENVLKERTVDHISLADSADLFMIAPATANCLAKLAYGIADHFLTTTILATNAPVLVCPSMNVHMWQHPAVQENVQRVKKLGYHLVSPASGPLACGYDGEGRLPETETLVDAVHFHLDKKTVLQGKRIVVTAGGTTEPIDDVRVITNRSSGKMGTALADACVRMGATVTLLKAKSAVFPRMQMKIEAFETVQELDDLLSDAALQHDICFHVAAVSDFSITKRDGKVSSKNEQKLNLTPRQKIYKELKTKNPHLQLYTFKAETERTEESWQELLKQTLQNNTMDGVIGNPVGNTLGFEVDDNELFVSCRDGRSIHIPKTTKLDAAEQLLTFLFTPSLRDQ